MARVLEECDHAAADFSADSVHDLRVALRRCHSVADGLIAIDPHPDWKAMKKAGRRLFRRLGELRDVQIMMEWIVKLRPAGAGVARALLPAMPEAPEHSDDLASGAMATEPAKDNLRDSVEIGRAHV